MPDGDGDSELARRTQRVVRAQRQQRTLPAKLEALAGLIQRTVPSCDAVSVGLLVQGDAGTGAVTSEIAIEADLAQYRSGDGPCLLSAATGHPVRVDVMGHDERFVHFAPLALVLGIESVLSVPLTHGGEVVGSLNLYSRRTGAFTDETAAGLADIADYAAEIISTSPLYVYTLDLLQHLELTVEQRATVETAVGMLMVANQCDETTAMTLLRMAATDEDRPLVETAEVVIAAHGPAGGAEPSEASEP